MVGSLIQKEMGEREVIEETFLKTHTHNNPSETNDPHWLFFERNLLCHSKKGIFSFFFFSNSKNKNIE
jgi:hypothetical protein